ncbi:MAG TPA: fumarylacetoacetate hydrolase family protein [Hyphomicrobium sp.]|nr:fumarylacetoacetate hydrolase family protein [Hyphomicrobium sp.]
MKLVRFGSLGAEKPGVVDVEGKIRDLSGHVSDFSGAQLDPQALAKLRAIDLGSLPFAPSGVRLGAPVAGTRNFVAIGLNYADHAKETGQELPAEPILFNKAPTSICGPNDDIMYPKNSDRMDWECEIAFVIGKRARYVDEADALSYIAGYTICNDVSERRWQVKRNGQWVKGKSAETFGPLGPWLVTTDEMVDPHNLSMSLDVNGDRKQTGSTSTMIFSIPKLLAYVTEFMVLEAGDVITTGTPPGVGSAKKPPEYLKAGDKLALKIEGLGEQHATVVPFSA